MKKILLIIFLLLVAMVSVSDSRMSGALLSGVGTATQGGGSSCEYQSGQSCTVATDDTTGASTGTYIGQGDYYPSSNMNLCQIDVWIVTAPTYDSMTVYVFEMSGTSLGTEVCHTETKAYGAISGGGWNTFSITGDCNIVTGGTTKYGIVATTGASFEIGDKAVSGGCTTQGGMAVWGSDKAITNNYMGDYDILFKVYGK